MGELPHRACLRPELLHRRALGEAHVEDGDGDPAVRVVLPRPVHGNGPAPAERGELPEPGQLWGFRSHAREGSAAGDGAVARPPRSRSRGRARGGARRGRPGTGDDRTPGRAPHAPGCARRRSHRPHTWTGRRPELDRAAQDHAHPAQHVRRARALCTASPANRHTPPVDAAPRPHARAPPGHRTPASHRTPSRPPHSRCADPARRGRAGRGGREACATGGPRAQSAGVTSARRRGGCAPPERRTGTARPTSSAPPAARGRAGRLRGASPGTRPRPGPHPARRPRPYLILPSNSPTVRNSSQ